MWDFHSNYFSLVSVSFVKYMHYAWLRDVEFTVSMRTRANLVLRIYERQSKKKLNQIKNVEYFFALCIV